MKVLLMMYLCLDPTHTDCQPVPVQAWARPDAYSQCAALVPELTDALTVQNRQRIYFRCEPQDDDAAQVQQATPQFIHQSFRF
jgi:hypothetical protein